MAFRVVCAVLLSLTGVVVASGQDRGRGEITIRAKDSQGGTLPGLPVVIRSLEGDRPVSEVRCVTSVEGTCTVTISKNYKFSISAALAGFLPVTLGPAFPPAEPHYHVVLVMNVLNPAFVTVP